MMKISKEFVKIILVYRLDFPSPPEFSQLIIIMYIDIITNLKIQELCIN